MIGCDCNVGLSNTGRPNCVPLFSVTNNLIQVPLFNNDGDLNGIDLTAPLPDWIADLVNAADKSERWFPIPAFENVELPKADSQFEEAASGRMAFLRQGKRSFMGELWADDSTPTFLGKLEKGRCVDFGVYIVDVNGNLIGSKVGNFLYPIPVDNASWDPKFGFATDSTIQKIMLGFDFDRRFHESTMYMITPAEAGIDFASLKGLIDVYLNFVGQPTTTQAVVTANVNYGTALNPVNYIGADAPADWVLTNVTTGLTVAIDAVTPDGNGGYTFDYSAGVTAGDVLNLATAKTGFEGESDATAI
jgi:hypothetical protein